jgi:hypothetical protein
MPEKRIEDLNPHYETVMGCLQYALKCLDKGDSSSAKHAIKDALRRLGFTQDAVDNPTIRL